MENSICKVCGSEYQITEHKMIYRDKDTIECDICDTIIKSWNGAVSYSHKLVKQGFRKAEIIANTVLYKESNYDAINTNIQIEAGECEVISPIRTYNLVPSGLVPSSGKAQFYKIKHGNTDGYILATFIKLKS